MKWIGLMAYPFFFMLVSFPVVGQHQSLTPLLNLEYQEVREAENMQDELSIYYANLADILEVLFTENTLDYQRLRKNRSARLNQIKSSALEKTWAQFLEAEIKLQWAFLDFRFEEDWDAFWGLRSAYKISHSLYKDSPNFEPNFRTLGVLKIILGTVAQDKQWILNLFGLEGNVFEGIRQIQQLDHLSDFRLESQLILGMVDVFMLEEFEKGNRRLNSVKVGGLLVDYIKALTLLKTHQGLQARRILETMPQNLPVLDYLIAETYFQQHDFTNATLHYQRFLTKNEGSAYVKDTHLKLALSAFYKNQIIEFQQELSQVISSGEDRTEIDKNALKLKTTLAQQDSVGLLIRFAIDGGFYEKAASLISLQETGKLSPAYTVELTYRKARMAHLQGQHSKAQALYTQVIEYANLMKDSYYIPNSFLQLGYLLRDTAQNEKAILQFNRVLEFKNHPYKQSLDTKARLALSRLSPSNDSYH